MDLPFLSIITFTPFVGVLLLFLASYLGCERRSFLGIALGTSIINFVFSLFVWAIFNQNNSGFQMIEYYHWIDYFCDYHLGVDGISILLVVLTAFLTPFCILSSWESVQERFKEYMIAFLILESMTIGAFLSLDIVLFYIFFEASLIPMFIIIGVWGGNERVYAAYKFFLYTFFGSVFMLLAIMVICWDKKTTSIIDLYASSSFPMSIQCWLWLAFFISFAIKIPMFPFHTWLPSAHVQAPTAGSVFLAGIMLKMGGYGCIRFLLPLFPLASKYFSPLILILSVISIIYASLVAMVQRDIKKLIAYSSIAHMGYVTIGIFSGIRSGVEGAMFQMLSHGLVSSALFFSIGILYDRLHTRDLYAYGGLVRNMPRYAVVMMVFTMANIGLPGTSGFIGEFLIIVSAFFNHNMIAVFASFGVVLSALYSLWFYRKIVFGVSEREEVKKIKDLSLRERCIVYPIAVLIVFFGIYTVPVFDTFALTISSIVKTDSFGK
ncbi:NADH-quinone oxidoreductase subunit M [Candidatus Liberibacter solanacearum]|uniref:NADH-quinone oxidoreductase subunit M n=1 Tax=Candidatus Liberibacter solanacearum TaxID=556287 RepID=A0A3R7QMB0_9HYPH|nr:NADH-quinone oxidoreductase subunit M [Candidatus Liberibacter solanacearum]RPD36932.1 NADH-quinone oxidoreductase subunit M [Candidatus Liberibacter solanacearum]